MSIIEEWYWQDFEEVGSTNDEAKLLAQSDNYDRFVVTSKKQSSGRGRRGREWIAIEGNLFASFGLKIDAKYIGELSFIVSLSALEMLKEYNYNLNVKLKWPNDVLVNDKKISGILIEREGSFFIIGIGINVIDYPKNVDLLYDAISMKDVNIQSDRLDVLNKYIKHLNHCLSEWDANGFEIIKQKWLDNAKSLGKEIIVKFENDEKKGLFSGVDDNGYLLLDIDGSIEKIYAGDVFYI